MSSEPTRRDDAGVPETANMGAAAAPRLGRISFRYRLESVLPFHLGMLAGAYRVVPGPDGRIIQFND